jgi:hypothetical protein
MDFPVLWRWAYAVALGLASTSFAQSVGPPPPQDSRSSSDAAEVAPSQDSRSSSPAPEVAPSEPGDTATQTPRSDAEPGDAATPEQPADQGRDRIKLSLLERLAASLSQEEDPDGTIDTDRPTFTPAHTVVPRGRLQLESGFTFTATQAGFTRSALYDFPELAARYGLAKRVEFRMFWLGQTFVQTQTRPGGLWNTSGGGLSDMEVGFKWQLIEKESNRKWIPITALITSIIAPTGGTSPLSAERVEPYLNLIYGWRPNDKFTFCGSTGYLESRLPGSQRLRRGADNFERFHQSLAAFISATERTTLFYEWYGFAFTNAADNRPAYFMDGGLLYRLTPNTQLDLRAGFGLTRRPDEFFTGVGFSVRF